ncbi:hypothetical protein DL93DRAFT_761873 [Clavulina sp. PMI_390]|nr:hypothetical protein DL93DRAFT_761873 [Clavulina sp. PMI_390]
MTCRQNGALIPTQQANSAFFAEFLPHRDSDGKISTNHRVRKASVLDFVLGPPVKKARVSATPHNSIPLDSSSSHALWESRPHTSPRQLWPHLNMPSNSRATTLSKSSGKAASFHQRSSMGRLPPRSLKRVPPSTINVPDENVWPFSFTLHLEKSFPSRISGPPPVCCLKDATNRSRDNDTNSRAAPCHVDPAMLARFGIASGHHLCQLPPNQATTLLDQIYAVCINSCIRG